LKEKYTRKITEASKETCVFSKTYKKITPYKRLCQKKVLECVAKEKKNVWKTYLG